MENRFLKRAQYLLPRHEFVHVEMKWKYINDFKHIESIYTYILYTTANCPIRRHLILCSARIKDQQEQK